MLLSFTSWLSFYFCHCRDVALFANLLKSLLLKTNGLSFVVMFSYPVRWPVICGLAFVFDDVGSLYLALCDRRLGTAVSL